MMKKLLAALVILGIIAVIFWLDQNKLVVFGLNQSKEGYPYHVYPFYAFGYKLGDTFNGSYTGSYDNCGKGYKMFSIKPKYKYRDFDKLKIGLTPDNKVCLLYMEANWRKTYDESDKIIEEMNKNFGKFNHYLGLDNMSGADEYLSLEGIYGMLIPIRSYNLIYTDYKVILLLEDTHLSKHVFSSYPKMSYLYEHNNLYKEFRKDPVGCLKHLKELKEKKEEEARIKNL